MAEMSSSIEQSAPPTLLKLKTMKGADSKPLKIVQSVAAHDYTTFGMCLLQDENGQAVALLKKNHIHDSAESVTEAILQKWLTSDAPTRTYQHFIECLRQSELGALAELIEKASGLCCSSLTSKVPKNTVSAVNAIASYAFYLKRRYNDMSQTMTAQHWSHLPQCEYIQLAMIDCKRRRHEVEEEEKRETLSQEGKVEPILDNKKPIELDSLFSTRPLVVLPPPSPKPRVVLVEAAPGGGKSTLALHICHQWAQGASFLERFDIVVLVYLRDGAIQDAKHLADILPADVLVSRMEIASEIIACRGKNVLFIFDGWDEFPSKLQNISVVSDIIRKSYELPLDDCTILITSRSESSLDLHDIANRRVEILGFTQERIYEYIHKALVKNDGSDTRVHKLIDHLKDHPDIESYCYVPLHAAILVHIFLTKSGVLPNTLHELFSEFLLCCVVRELKTHDKIDFEVPSLEKLREDFNCKLNDLRVLAYKGVMQNKAIFYEEDLLEFNLPLKLKTFGLLQSVEGLTISCKSVSYNFLHFSVQEHLAAYCISMMSSAEQVEVFRTLLQNREQSRFQAVLHHYSGFTKLDNSEIQHFISTYSERQSSIRGILPLLQCFYEAQQPSLCKLVGPQFRNIDVKGHYNYLVDPINYLFIGYFITSLLSTSDVRLIIYDITDEHRLKLLLVELCKQGDEELPGRLQLVIKSSWITVMEYRRPQWELLFSHLQQLRFINDVTIDSDIQVRVLTDSMLENNCHLTKLGITRNYGFSDPVQSITAMLHSTKLTHLSLSGTPISDEGASCVFRCLQDNKTLLNLNLSDIRINLLESTVQELLSMLKINKTLTHLDLSNNEVRDVSTTSLSVNLARTVFQGLCHNTTLVHLNLSHTNFAMSEKTGQALVTMLQVNKTLTHLDLSHNLKFSNSEACYLFHGLQHNTSLVHLNLTRTAIDFETKLTAEMLSTMLQVNNTLKHLDLSINRVYAYSYRFQKSFVCILQGLQLNTSLVYLNLSNVGFMFTADTTQALTAMLQVNKTLTHLDLSYNNDSPFQVSRIWEALMHNTTLTHLNLGSTKLQFNDQALATMLQVNKTLTHLDLSDNQDFIDLGVHCVCQGLQHNTALLHLDLSRTELTDKGAEYIAQALHLNRSLQTLDISYNESIADDGFALIAESLKSNKTLKTLYIYGCSITPRLAQTVYQAKYLVYTNRFN